MTEEADSNTNASVAAEAAGQMSNDNSNSQQQAIPGDHAVITPLQLTQAPHGQTYLMAPWPAHTSIPHGAIDGKLVSQGDGVSYPKEIITIKPANGMAQYRIDSDDGESMVLELTPGSVYEPLQDTQTTQAQSAPPPPDTENLIRRTIIAEACTLRPEFAKKVDSLPNQTIGANPIDSATYADIPDDLLAELAELFSDPRDLDLFTVVQGEINHRSGAGQNPANENVRTVDHQGKHIA